MTAHAIREDLERSIEAKPAQTAELVRLLRRVAGDQPVAGN